MRKLALALATCGMLIGTSLPASAATYAPKVGQRHPDFTLPKIEYSCRACWTAGFRSSRRTPTASHPGHRGSPEGSPGTG